MTICKTCNASNGSHTDICPEAHAEPPGFFDRIMDGADKLFDGVERAFTRPDGTWVAEDIVDGTTGQSEWTVHVPGRRGPQLVTTDRQLAERVAGLLNGAVPK